MPPIAARPPRALSPVLAALLILPPLLAAAGPAGAQADDAAPPSRGAAILLEQAGFWSTAGRPELARQALDRLLAIDPSNPQALRAAAEAAASSGDRAAAEAYTRQLEQQTPGTAEAVAARAALRATALDQAQLAEARRLAQAGHLAAAVERYRQIFGTGGVPDSLAGEFYQTLGGASPDSFEEARQGLAAAVARSPRSEALQLALAQLLTYNEVTRPEGLTALAGLAQSPAFGAIARSSWRQALLWSGADPDNFEAIGTYLQSNPPDPEILAKLEESRGTIIPPWMVENMAAWVAFSSGRIADAEGGFTRALELAPDNHEVLSGLATVRQAQGRQADARALLLRARDAAPDDQREEIARRLAELDQAATRAAAPGNGAVPPSRIALAWQALNRNRLAEAERLARPSARARGEEKLQGEVVLGLVALRQRDTAAAESHIRTALALNPRATAAQAAMYELLQAQRRYEEADRYATESGYRPGPNAATSRAAALQEEARDMPDADRRISLLRSAVVADGRNAWAAYDLARALRARKLAEEARRVERELAARGTPDALFAAALLAEQEGRNADVVARLGAIPPRARSQEAARLLARSQRAQELRQLEQAARSGPQSPAARRMLALAAQPDPEGETAAGVIRAFARLHQMPNAEAAARQAGGAGATPAAQVAIAAALLEAGKEGDAAALAAGAERDPRLPAEQRRLAADIQSASVAAAADRLQRDGNADGAVRRLRPALARAPQDPQLQLSLARVYANDGRADEALRITQSLLDRDPGNSSALSVAGDAALAARRLGQAEEILAQGRARQADALQMALLDARIARARGDNARARAALEEAARLRSRQLQAEATP